MTVPLGALERAPVFQGMTDRALQALAELASEVEFAAGDLIIRESTEGDAFYLLLDGRATVSQGGRVITSIGPGDFIGEVALLEGRLRTATVTAQGPIRAIEIQRSAFMNLMERFPSVRLGIMMALTERMRADERDAAV